MAMACVGRDVSKRVNSSRTSDEDATLIDVAQPS
jgi:hypothetical protein